MYFIMIFFFDLGFYSDVVLFFVLMEIFVKYKIFFVFFKVEFGLKKLIILVVIKNLKELRFNEKKL